jgi:hypothetical protein
MTGNRLTGCFNLSTGDPGLIQGFDSKGSKGKVMTTLGIPFHPALLLPPEFCFFRL